MFEWQIYGFYSHPSLYRICEIDVSSFRARLFQMYLIKKCIYQKTLIVTMLKSLYKDYKCFDWRKINIYYKSRFINVHIFIKNKYVTSLKKIRKYSHIENNLRTSNFVLREECMIISDSKHKLLRKTLNIQQL